MYTQQYDKTKAIHINETKKTCTFDYWLTNNTVKCI